MFSIIIPLNEDLFSIQENMVVDLRMEYWREIWDLWDLFTMHICYFFLAREQNQSLESSLIVYFGGMILSIDLAEQICTVKTLRNHSQKSFRAKLPFSAFAKLKFCTISQLEFCAIPQFRKTQTVGDGVCFLEFNSGKILFWNVFL